MRIELTPEQIDFLAAQVALKIFPPPWSPAGQPRTRTAINEAVTEWNTQERFLEFTPSVDAACSQSEGCCASAHKANCPEVF